MAEIVLFHHAVGLTAGVRELGDKLATAGHKVHLPDLYQGRTFGDLDSGVAHAESVGFEEIVSRGSAAVQDLPGELVYAGLSLGVMPAQNLAQTRRGAAAALLLHSFVPIAAFSESWPAGVPVQMHVMEDDEWGDVDVARQLDAEIAESELFLYPGSAHLFSDSAVDGYDAAATEVMLDRILAFLGRLS